MDIDTKFKPGRLSPITRQIADYMRLLSKGEVVTYDDLKELTGFVCQSGGSAYQYLDSAIKKLEKEGHLFANIPGEGYRKLNPNEGVQERGRKLTNIGRQVSRHTNVMSIIDSEQLGPIEKMEQAAFLVVGRLASRHLSEKGKMKLIHEIKKQPERERIDYEGLTEIYVRKHVAKT